MAEIAGINTAKLPKWAIPVTIGGGIGAVVLLTRKKPTTPISNTALPVSGQGNGTTNESDTMHWNQLMSQLSESDATHWGDLLDTIGQTNSDTLSSISTSNEHTLDTIMSIITGQNTAAAAQWASFLDVFNAGQQHTDELIGTILTQEQNQPPPTTARQSIVNAFKSMFSAAFDRIPKPSPVGTTMIQPDSDITYDNTKDFTYYDTTGHSVSGHFRQFLGNFGGARTYGRPISQVFVDRDGYETQLFDNAIMKYIPGSNPQKYDIVLIPLVGA